MSPCSICGWLLMDPGLFSLVQAAIGCCDFRCLWLCHAQKMAFHNPFLFLPSLRCFHSLFCYVPWVLGVPVIVLFRAKHSAITLSTFGSHEVDQMSPSVVLRFKFWDSVSCWSWSSPVCRDWLTSRPSILLFLPPQSGKDYRCALLSLAAYLFLFQECWKPNSGSHVVREAYHLPSFTLVYFPYTLLDMAFKNSLFFTTLFCLKLIDEFDIFNTSFSFFLL